MLGADLSLSPLTNINMTSMYMYTVCSLHFICALTLYISRSTLKLNCILVRLKSPKNGSWSFVGARKFSKVPFEKLMYISETVNQRKLANFSRNLGLWLVFIHAPSEKKIRLNKLNIGPEIWFAVDCIGLDLYADSTCSSLLQSLIMAINCKCYGNAVHSSSWWVSLKTTWNR